MPPAALAARPHEICDLRLGAGRSLRVRSWPGRGRPLVLLHGLLDDSEGWAQLARDTHRPAIAIDLPGFGGSDLPSRPRLSAYAEAVVAGIEQLELPEITLVGHSFGGAVATAVAERCSAVRALVLLAPVGYGRIPLAEAMTLPGVRQAAELAMPVALVNPLTVTAAYATFVAHHRLPSRDLMGRIVRRSFRSGPGVSAAVQAVAAAGRSQRAFATRAIDFAGPVAALWGEHDALVPREHIEALRRALPQAHVEVWDGMGHHAQRERPQQLASFIERHAGRTAGAEAAAGRGGRGAEHAADRGARGAKRAAGRGVLRAA